MSMSTHIVGIVPPDTKWKKMKRIYDSYKDAELPIPDDIEMFFNFEPPDNAGVLIDLDHDDSVTEWSDDTQEGFEVDLDKLPKHVIKLRFYNAY